MSDMLKLLQRRKADEETATAVKLLRRGVHPSRILRHFEAAFIAGQYGRNDLFDVRISPAPIGIRRSR